MPVQLPSYQLPATLEERGPSGDRSLVLSGTASIGDARLQIVAIRINVALSQTPDYRTDVGEGAYAAEGLDDVLEAILEEFEYRLAQYSTSTKFRTSASRAMRA